MAKDRKPRTPKTDEQKAAEKQAHAARERERYALSKKAGLTRDQARSVKKAIDQLPDVLKEPTEGMLDLIGGVRGLAASIFKFGIDITAGQLPTIGNEPEATKTSKPTKTRRSRDYSSWLDFLTENPGLSTNKALKKYREEGGKIGRDKAVELFREQRGTVKDVIRKTRFKYYSNTEKPIFDDKKLIKDQYMYLVEYETELDNGTTQTDWQYVASDEPLTLREIKEGVLQQWDDGQGADVVSEKYKAVRIIPESIHLIHAVDTHL